MAWLVLWVTGTIAMVERDSSTVAFIAFGLGTVLALVRNARAKQRVSLLEQRYAVFYGQTKLSTGDLKGTRYGGAAGMLLGHYVAGGLIGAAVDLVREARARTDASTDERQLLDEIARTRMGSAAFGLMWLGFGLIASAIVHAF